MNRRSFLMKLGAGMLGALVVRPSIDINEIFKPSQRQIDFLFGIPYHQTNGTTGNWLGFDRATYHPNVVKVYNQLLKD